LVKYLNNAVKNFTLTALEPGSSMDQLVKQNAAASQIAALDYAKKLPYELLATFQTDLSEIRQQMLLESVSDEEYEDHEGYRPSL
jgi:hypothetical protein